MERFGVRSYVIRGDSAAVRAQLNTLRREAGVGRTLIKLGAKDDWLRGRNPLLKAFVSDGVQVCEAGVCTELLDDLSHRLQNVSM
jgi:hypothetical protein